MERQQRLVHRGELRNRMKPRAWPAKCKDAMQRTLQLVNYRSYLSSWLLQTTYSSLWFRTRNDRLLTSAAPEPLTADAAAHLLELAPRTHGHAECRIYSMGPWRSTLENIVYMRLSSFRGLLWPHIEVMAWCACPSLGRIACMRLTYAATFRHAAVSLLRLPS